MDNRPTSPNGRAVSDWLITLAATAASTYALDAVATAAGVLLVASQLLNGLDHALVLAFLAATYLTWGVTLRANLGANWSLLERTGTSTNALSKAAFELTRRKGARAQRIATAVGYVATEVGKEVPYYAGAFGAAAVTDSVSSTDALLFLAGANLGAAAYEYGLAHLTRGVLRRRRYASFDSDWVPRDYLSDYYRVVEPDERETIAFFASAMEHAAAGQAVLVFGTGPTLHHVFLAAPKASEIHLADYLPTNLEEIERWRTRDPAAHDWRAFVRYTLECEGLADPTDQEITQREELTRSNITGLVGSDGLFLTAALRRCRSYSVGDKRFPSANVDEHDLRRVLRTDFIPQVAVRGLHGHDGHGYSSVVLARAQRRARPARRLAPAERPVRGLRSGIRITDGRSV
jgi:hypothetical protein